uniref:Uncharacterized protein n=1 Tax=Meloidogyne incognita TaxID=6306 RepID=A0A914KNK5_MELIC
MWLFLLLMCVSYLHAVLHGGEGTSKPSSDHNEIEDSILQEYPKYANMDFSDGHLQALLKTSQNYPISKIFSKIWHFIELAFANENWAAANVILSDLATS